MYEDKVNKLKLLKIGRQYKVKTFERLIKEYGIKEGHDVMPNVVCGFNETMKNLCGRKLTIDRPFEGREGKLYHVKEASWCWNSQMFELPLSTLIYRRRHG